LRSQAQPYLEPNALGDDPGDMGRMVGWWEKYPHKALYRSCTVVEKKTATRIGLGNLEGDFFHPIP